MAEWLSIAKQDMQTLHCFTSMDHSRASAEPKRTSRDALALDALLPSRSAAALRVPYMS